MPGSRRKRAAGTAITGFPVPQDGAMTRKTRLMSKAGVTLIQVQVFQDGILCSTRLRLCAPLSSETFSDLDAAIEAFRSRTTPPSERPRLRAA